MRYWAIACLMLAVSSSGLRAQDQTVPDDQVAATFVKDCTELSAAIPDLGMPCDDLAAGKAPAVVRQYLSLLTSVKQSLLAKGPEIAQALLTSCLANAVADKPDPGGLLFCIKLKSQGSDLEILSQGKGSLPDYGKLAKNASDPVPVYPSGNSKNAEAQRAEVRKDLVYGCIEQQQGYVQALCGAVAVHEIFADRPFGDNGELAQAFDKVLKLYVITEAPRLMIQEEVKEALQRAGVNDQVAQAIANPQQGVVEGAKHVASEVQKAADTVQQALEDLNPFN